MRILMYNNEWINQSTYTICTVLDNKINNSYNTTSAPTFAKQHKTEQQQKRSKLDAINLLNNQSREERNRKVLPGGIRQSAVRV